MDIRRIFACAAFVVSGVLVLSSAPARADDLPPTTRKFLAQIGQQPSLLKEIDAALAVSPALIDAARKEQGIRIGGTWDPKQFREMAKPFEERYPFVKLTYLRASRFQRTVKPLIALQEGRVIVDVLSSLSIHVLNYRDAGALAPLGDLPAYKGLEPAMQGQDGLWAAQRVLFRCMGYNTKLVKKSDLPKDWDDILTDPRFHGGKIGMTNKPDDWFMHLIPSRGMEWGRTYLETLFTKVKPQLRKEGSNAVAALAVAGEFPYTLVSASHRIRDLQKKGAPIDIHCPGSVAGAVSEIGVLKASPSVNQGLLFTNWFISREGQLAQFAVAHYDPLYADMRDAGLESVPKMMVGKKVFFHTTAEEEKYGPQINAMWSAYWYGQQGLKMETVKVRLDEVKDGGRAILFKNKGASHTARVSSGGTVVKVGGKISARDGMKAGMTCDVTYPGNKQTAIEIACIK
jgi:ABC-type Fe3+ transport system substrate-binding protein